MSMPISACEQVLSYPNKTQYMHFIKPLHILAALTVPTLEVQDWNSRDNGKCLTSTGRAAKSSGGHVNEAPGYNLESLSAKSMQKSYQKHTSII